MFDFLYESALIQEVSQEVVDYIEVRKESLPFDSIFGDEMRIIIPMSTDDISSEIVSTLRKIKDYQGIDLDSKEVVRKIKLDQKYGGGEKEQRVNIGKAIQKLKIPEDKKKEYLDWFARYKDNLKQEIKESQYSIILSRDPEDVVRMSDHRNIRSCHSQGGSYFQCAVQEAISGGAVAYLINKDSIDEYRDNLQKSELFRDPERGIRGMESPLARLKVRRGFVNGKEIAIPETKIYGDNRIPGFYDSLRDYLQNKQNVDVESVKNSDVEIYGGTYSDSDISSLLGKYFDQNIEIDDLQFVDVDQEMEHQGIDNQLERELEQIHENYVIGRTDETFNIEYTVDDYVDNPFFAVHNQFFTVHGTIIFDVSDFEFDIPMIDIPDIQSEEDLQSAIDGEFDDDEDWSELEWSTFFDHIADYHGFSDPYLQSFIVDHKKKTIELMFSGHSNIEGELFTESSDYQQFVNEMLYLRKNKEDVKNILEEGFKKIGAVTDKKLEQDEYSTLKKILAYEEDYEHIDLKASSRTLKGSIEYHVPIYNQRSKEGDNTFAEFVNLIRRNFSIKNSEKIQSSIKKIFFNILDDLYQPSPKIDDRDQMKFKQFYESVNNKDQMGNFVITNVISNYTLNKNRFFISLKFEGKDLTNDFFELLDAIDDGHRHIQNALIIYFIQLLDSIAESQGEGENYRKFYIPNNFEQMKKVYSKYL